MPVFIKMIDGSNIVTEQFTLAQIKTKIEDAQGNGVTTLDILDIGGETVFANLRRVSYVKELANT